MICQQCGTHHQADARFCTRCGHVLAGKDVTPAVSTALPGKGERMAVWFVGGLCLLYLINPTLGVFELIPDNLPIIGNLDELTASAGLLWALKQVGVRLPGF